MDKITWPMVAIVALVLGAIMGMVTLHADPRTIFDALLLLGLGGVGVGIAGVHGKVNGNITDLNETARDAMSKMTATVSDMMDKFSAAVTDAMDKLYNATPKGPDESSEG